MVNKNKEEIERLILKLPKSVADYFRSAFPHGKRSNFVAECLIKHKHDKELKSFEEKLRKAGRARQKN